MSIRYLMILIVPIILHNKGNKAILVFLIMNSIISVLMEYTKAEMKMLGYMINNQDRVNELIDAGVEFDEAFKEYLETEDVYLPKPISFASKISMTINIAAILLGIVNIIRNVL